MQHIKSKEARLPPLRPVAIDGATRYRITFKIYHRHDDERSVNAPCHLYAENGCTETAENGLLASRVPQDDHSIIQTKGQVAR